MQDIAAQIKSLSFDEDRVDYLDSVLRHYTGNLEISQLCNVLGKFTFDEGKTSALRLFVKRCNVQICSLDRMALITSVSKKFHFSEGKKDAMTLLNGLSASVSPLSGSSVPNQEKPAKMLSLQEAEEMFQKEMLIANPFKLDQNLPQLAVTDSKYVSSGSLVYKGEKFSWQTATYFSHREGVIKFGPGTRLQNREKTWDFSLDGRDFLEAYIKNAMEEKVQMLASILASRPANKSKDGTVTTLCPRCKINTKNVVLECQHLVECSDCILNAIVEGAVKISCPYCPLSSEPDRVFVL